MTDQDSKNRKRQHRILSVGALALFFGIWELVAQAGWIRPIFISSPSRVIKSAIWLADHGLWDDLLTSGTEFGLGIIAALLVGLPMGVLLGWYPRLAAPFDPFIDALYATPKLALLPIIILWFGIGMASKVAVVFLGAVIPLLVSTMAGMRAVDSDLHITARSFGANDLQVFQTLALPSAVPFILSGLRLGVGRGLVGVVVGEMIAAQQGIGHMMSVAAATFQTDQTFVGILILAATGILLNRMLAALEGRFELWRPERQ